MLPERCLNALYRSRLYDLFLGRQRPTAVSQPVFDHTLSAQSLCYAEGKTSSLSSSDGTIPADFRSWAAHKPTVHDVGQMLDAWIPPNDQFDPKTWRADIAGERVTRWINAYPALATSLAPALSEHWLIQIRRHARHLNRSPSTTILPWRRFLYHQGRLAAALAFTEFAPTLPGRLHAFGDDVDQQILADGSHISRSPAITLAVLALLIEIRDALIAHHIEAPSGLISAIDRISPWIKGMRHGDGGFALINGATASTSNLIDDILSASGSRARAMSHAPHSGFYRMRAGQTTLLVDCGRDDAPHSPNPAPASFEFSVGKARIFSNCGTRLGNDNATATWRDILHATAAHSALIIDNKNTGAIGIANVDRRDHDGARLIECEHDGYAPAFGIRHKRAIYLDAAGTDIRGEDQLANGISKPFSIRFHLHPGVNVSMVEGGGEVIIKPTRGRGWRFQSDHPIMLDDSVNFFDGRQHRTQQIVILGNHEPAKSIVKWRVFSG